MDFWLVLLGALEIEHIPVERIEKPKVYLNSGHCIEWERGSLFKLSYRDQVIAPFDDLEEMIRFIKLDKQT